MARLRLSGYIGVTAVLACLLPLSACGTATIDDAVPAGAYPQPPLATAAPATPDTATAAQVDEPSTAPAASFSRPGDFPNLNVIPKPAAAQITTEEKETDTTLLRSIRAQQRAQGAAGKAGSTAAELRRIGRSHASDALKQIQGE